MKITDVKTIQLKYTYPSYIADGCGTCSARSALLVLVETDSELYGIGESATFGGSLSAVADIIEHQLKPLLVGEDPEYIEKLWQKMLWNNWSNGRRGLVMGAVSGIDIALWDLMGKMAHMPVAQLLGKVSDRVQGYASAGFYAPGKSLDDLKREIEGYLERGYTAFKMKIGRTSANVRMPLQFMKNGDFCLSPEEDRKRVELVRNVIGKDCTLMLDMNCTWDIEEVIQAETFFEENKIFMIEEPARSDDIRGYARIASALKKVRVAGIESEQGLMRYREILEAGAADVVQANLGWSGGFSECRKIAALSQAYNKLFTPHTFCSAVLTAANVHFASAQINVPFIESEENANPLRTELLKTPLACDQHMNYLTPQGPGLGIELDWDAVERYRIS